MIDAETLRMSPAAVDAALDREDPASLRAAFEAEGLETATAAAVATLFRRDAPTFEALLATSGGLRAFRGLVGPESCALADDGENRDEPLPLAVAPTPDRLLHLLLLAAEFGERPQGRDLPDLPDPTWPVAVLTGTWDGGVVPDALEALAPRGWWSLRARSGSAEGPLTVLDAGTDGLYEQQGTYLTPTSASAIWRRAVAIVLGSGPHGEAGG